MRARTIALLALGAYLVFLVATVPARWALAHAAPPPGLALSDVDGTVWNGTATLVTQPGAPIADVRWHFLPSRLASARIAFDIDANGAALQGHGEVARGIGGIEAHGVKARGDAAALCALMPLAAAWRPEGRFTLDAPALAWDGRTARGAARVEWRDASLAISDVRPLGSYRVEVRADGGPARFDVSTLDGALRIAGHGTFAPPDALAFSGEARAEGNSAAALEPLLNLLGPRRADGARAIDWRTVPRTSPPRS